ncbi:MAG: class I SAM-dependent methyltransferase [Bdellovibrionales bacterium]|nr:class I SAM-dependent methyltransferase [Bdellovibrionales bacterium]
MDLSLEKLPGMGKWLRGLKGQNETAPPAPVDDLPLTGFEPSSIPTPNLDLLSDEQLSELNQLVRWFAFTVDSKGRRVGQRANPNKRAVPQEIPDPRIRRMHELLDLKDKSVLEVGCFEGIHTIGLCQYAKHVVAVDARLENVAKATLRAGFYNVSPTFKVADVERDYELLEGPFDCLFHIGVLYHLSDPVAHLKKIAAGIRRGLVLDTHYSTDEKATQSYVVDGKTYRFMPNSEHPERSVFEGMYDHSKRLPLDDLVAVVKDCGFAKIHVLEPREERNGPRVLIIAEREMQ